MRLIRSTSLVFFVVFSAAHLLLAQVVAAPQQQVPDPKTLTLKVFSRETLVDVTVEDERGRPVRGLSGADFTVKEDGKPQPIRGFNEYGMPEERRVPPPLPPHVYSNVQATPDSSAVNIFLLDAMSQAPGDSSNAKALSGSLRVQHDVKEGSMAYLREMPAGTRVAVFGLTNNLRILQGFSSDPGVLAAAVNTLDYDMDGRASGKEMACMQQDMRNRSALEALRQIAVYAGRTKGRKNLIWFTVGIPQITDPAQRPGCLPDYSRDLSNTYNVLAAAQVAIYPVDVRGGMMGAAQLSEDMVAEATGGKAFYGTTGLTESIAKAVEHGSSYYTLSYTPPNPKFDGQKHSISVSVDRPGLRLNYRDAYFADDMRKYPVPAGITLPITPPIVHGDDMKAAMTRGVPISSQLLFDVHVEPAEGPRKPGAPPVLGMLDAKLRGRPLVRYDFQYVLPARQLTFTDGPKGTRQGLVDYDIAVYDGMGKLLTSLSQTVTMPLSQATYKQLIAGPVRFFQQIDLPAGDLFVRVGVLDRKTEKVGTLELPLSVSKKGAVSAKERGN
jgi:VWFA-related protein